MNYIKKNVLHDFRQIVKIQVSKFLKSTFNIYQTEEMLKQNPYGTNSIDQI